MKKFIILVLLVTPIFSQAQKLTIQETVDYINGAFAKNSYHYFLELSNDGIISIYRDKKNNPEFPYLNKMSMHWSEVTFGKNSNSSPLQITFNCKKTNESSYFQPSCITVIGRLVPGNFQNNYIFIDDKYSNDKLHNAFTYLRSELELSQDYNRNDDDPFAPENFVQKKSTVLYGNESENIDLETFNGVYKVWIKIGTLNKHFVLDSGASEISLSKSTERELIENGIIQKEDYIESALYRIADGSIIKCRRLVIPEMIIGNYTIKNVRASIGVSDSPLLLGRSFLDNFKKWSIDNQNKKLILEK